VRMASLPISEVTGHREYGLGVVGVSFEMRKRRETDDYAKTGGNEGGRRVFLEPSHHAGSQCSKAAINFLQTSLDGTNRLIVFPGRPIRFNAPTGLLFCAYPGILLTLWAR
jgi:hypothetical protein